MFANQWVSVVGVLKSEEIEMEHDTKLSRE
jgi:hypothetical protein